MSEVIITAVFEVESEAYQAMSDLRSNAVTNDYVISQAALVKKENGTIETKDWFDTGVETADDTDLGGLLGATLGILGGPLGVLLGGAYGTMVGGAVDVSDAQGNQSMFDQVAKDIKDGDTALIVLAQEERQGSVAGRLSSYKVTISTDDAAEVANQVEQAEKLQQQMAADARKKMRETKANEHREKVEQKRKELKEQFEKLRSRF